MKLFTILQKNLRLVFRNWTTFALLVLGPMVLILIVGFAFSGDELHDIILGVHASKDANITSVTDALASADVQIRYFPKIEQCITAMNHSAVNICADFADDFSQEGAITFYYDATRYNLVRYILEYLKEKVALSSEQVSLQAAEQIFSDINQFVEDMKIGQQQVNDLQASAVLLRQDLVEAHDDVAAAQAVFVPKYMLIKEAQQRLNDTVIGFSETYGENANATTIIADLIALQETLQDVNTTLTAAELAVSITPFYNATYFAQVHTALDRADSEMTITLDTLTATGNVSAITLQEATVILNQSNEIVRHLDDINTSLAETEQKLAHHIVNIDAGVINLQGLSASFGVYITQFSSINETDAERFLHPITAGFESIPPEADKQKTAIVFPIILIFMLSFIAILLSNMLVLNETHSPAYFRNFLIPVNNVWFILGLFFTNLLLIAFQLFVLFVVAYFSFTINFFMNLPLFILAVIVAMVLYILAGMFFAYWVSDRQTSLLLSLFFALIMFFFSDIIFPLEIMPKSAAFLAQFNPFVVAEDLFRQILFYGHDFHSFIFQFGILGLYIILFAVLVVVSYYGNRKRR
jgi:ABC-type multidrug transport system permease subunit